MNILIAPDSFKGTLSSAEVSRILRDELEKQKPGHSIKILPLADGGEGSIDVLALNKTLKKRSMVVKGPLFGEIESYYYYEPATDTAYIEMAKASGITLLDEAELNAMDTTTYGTGELIKDALRQGARKVFVFVGGSATNDAGMGMAEALGVTFRNRYRQKLLPVGRNLKYVCEVEDYRMIPEVKDAEIIVATDVNNPFYGKEGAAYVYARQKGAGNAEIRRLDEGLEHFAALLKKQYHFNLQEMPGSGAAGGLGGGCVTFLNARIESGADVIFRELHFEQQVAWANLIISGEGKIDKQSLYEKLLARVSVVAKQAGVPLWAVCGYLDGDPEAFKQLGLAQIFRLAEQKDEIAEAMDNAADKLREKTANIAALL